MAYSSPLHRQSGCYDMASPVATVGNMLQLAPCLSRVLTPAGRTSARARRRHADGSGKECRRLRIRSTACTSYWLPTAEICAFGHPTIACRANLQRELAARHHGAGQPPIGPRRCAYVRAEGRSIARISGSAARRGPRRTRRPRASRSYSSVSRRSPRGAAAPCPTSTGRSPLA
jgi:hypothetical protein